MLPLSFHGQMALRGREIRALKQANYINEIKNTIILEDFEKAPPRLNALFLKH